MAKKTTADPKNKILKESGTLNKYSDKVHTPLFENHPFFDAHDLVQVKYEMLRAVEKDKESVLDAAKAFGFSRVSFYKTQEEFNNKGMQGLLPKKRGPQTAHKLTQDAMDFILQNIEQKPDVAVKELVKILETEKNIKIHKRTLEKALAALKKNTLTVDIVGGVISGSKVKHYYEDLRSYALGHQNGLTIPLGMDLFIKKGMATWMMAWNNYDLPIDSRSVLPRERCVMPQAIQPEITMLLANMIMSCGGV